MTEEASKIREKLSDHQRKLFQIHTDSLALVKKQINDLSQTDQLIPPVKIHEALSRKTQINQLCQEVGAPSPYEITKPDINPDEKTINSDLTQEEIQRLQKKLEIHWINYHHWQSEQKRLEARDKEFPVNLITSEKENIQQLEKELYST